MPHKNSLVQALGATAVLAVLFAQPAMADVRAGVDAWSQGNYDAAIAEWRGPAVAGDADAQFNMGQAYKLGRGVPQDLAIAEDWFKRAADQGHLQAEDNYGLLLFQAGRRTQALPYLTKSASRGEPRAQYILGTAHFNGDIVPKDWVRAYALMTRAAASGLPQAGQSLATMDQYVPIAERQQGIALAGELEREADRARNQALAASAVTAPATPATSPRRAPRPIPTAAVPPSTVAAADAAAAAAAAASAPAAAPDPATAGADFANPVPVQVGQTPRSAPARRPAPAPVAVAAANLPAAAANGQWRIQLGAFSAQSRAESLWSSLETRHPDLAAMQPFLVRAGTITRLQAGPFASKGDADRACRALAGSVTGCISVRP